MNQNNENVTQTLFKVENGSFMGDKTMKMVKVF